MDREKIIREAFRGLLRKDFEGNIDRIPLAEMGIDSLDFFEALIELEEQHGLKIPIEKLDGNLTLVDIFDLSSS
jgi:acyl carrier protein